MANGIIANQVDAAALKIALATSAIPVYLGQAPIWQIDDEHWADLAGKTFDLVHIEGAGETARNVREGDYYAVFNGLELCDVF